jgi:hypothetical protein
MSWSSARDCRRLTVATRCSVAFRRWPAGLGCKSSSGLERPHDGKTATNLGLVDPRPGVVSLGASGRSRASVATHCSVAFDCSARWIGLPIIAHSGIGPMPVRARPNLGLVDPRHRRGVAGIERGALGHPLQLIVPSRSIAALAGSGCHHRPSGIGPEPVRARPNLGLVDPRHRCGVAGIEQTALEYQVQIRSSVAFDRSACWIGLPIIAPSGVGP